MPLASPCARELDRLVECGFLPLVDFPPLHHPALDPLFESRDQESAAAEESANASQQCEIAHMINGVLQQAAARRQVPESQWKVTSEGRRLRRHWRYHSFSGIRPFFCGVATIIWLIEVAPRGVREAQSFLDLDHLESANEQANPNLSRLALKLATGAGNTTVMAVLIAWRTVNVVLPARPGYAEGTLFPWKMCDFSVLDTIECGIMRVSESLGSLVTAPLFRTS